MSKTEQEKISDAMAILGKRGGLKKSRAKAEACRRNGRKNKGKVKK